MALIAKHILNKQINMKTKLYTMASMLAVFNLNAIEIGPTGSGVELGGFVDYSITPKTKLVIHFNCTS